jgi:hypothetical protein
MALSQMVLLSINVYDADIKVKHIGVDNVESGAGMSVGYYHGYRLVLLVDLPDNRDLGGLITSLQKYIIEDIERFTGILIEEVNIVVDKFTQI